MAQQNSPPPHRLHYQGHRKRLRARLADAPEKLTDYEILELLLGYAILRRDTKPVAKELLARFGSLRGVIEAQPERYLDIPGIGEGVAGFMALLGRLPQPEGFDTPRLVPSTALLAIVSLAFAGIAAGLYPARKAALLEPVEALRRE